MTVIAVPFHLDERLPDFVAPLRPDLFVEPELPAGTPWERMAVLYAEVAGAVEQVIRGGDVPVVCSGDCTTSLAVMCGMQRAGLDPAMVWFDAHGDLQTPQTSTSGYLGGMPIRQLIGGADRTVPDALGLRPVAAEDVVLVGARDLDPPEVEFLATSAISRVSVDAVPLPAQRAYLHLDVDVVDPGELAGLLFPVAGGPGLSAVGRAVGGLVAARRIAAVGLACTWKPDQADVPAVAAMLTRHLAELL